MDRAAVLDGRDVRDMLPRLPNRPDRPDAAAAARVSHAIETQPPSTASVLTHTPPPSQPAPSQQLSFDTLPPVSSASSSFQSNGGHTFAHQPPYSTTTATTTSDSQDTASSAATTASSTDADPLYTDANAGANKYGGHEHAHGHAHEHDFPSQESQLLQLSTLAAARERMTGTSVTDSLDTNGQASRKRTADGSVKHTRNASSASPLYVGGHSRNTSTVSVASTAGSRIGELSAELKARLSYAMVKVNNGWHTHSIDQVENLASQAGSPTATSSNTSTVHGRHAASVSPRIPDGPSHNRRPSQVSQASVSTANTTIAPASRSATTLEPSQWSSQHVATAAPARSLAPPASIQPARPRAPARRRSNPNDTVSTFAAAYAHHASPHTPSNLVGSPAQHATPAGEPMLFSPDQNVREQDAIETLLFMSSPGNSANMKNFPSFTSASQPLPSGYRDSHQQPSLRRASPQRHALPTAPRRALPSPQFYSSQPPSTRRGGPGGSDRTMGHRRSPSDIDMDEPYGHPRSVKGTPRRRANGAYHGAEIVSPRLKVPLSMPSGLSVPSKPRPILAEEDIERMLDRAAAADESSDSDSEILIPARRTGPIGM